MHSSCYAVVVLSVVSKSFNVLPLLSLHSVNPFEFRPSTIDDAVEGLLKI